ncbi:MAG: flagellar basal body P-ring protein FlgI [Deltaproteobacteria bacterium]|nr:flagellar basal body P-ring protein FlgI [Deltaproteobacteria bacterium]MBW2085350.1 flagellar basal body P-ring protein FlgI [Deltaproteobacteria bacterium]
MTPKKVIIAFTVLIIVAFQASGAWGIRLKDIATFEGVRSNQLIGYGLVAGLSGTGDKSGTTFTIQSLTNMLKQMGIQVSPRQVRVKNVAAVMVTAGLPPFAKPGNKIDVLISSLGDATSLQGGTLLSTPLYGMDRKIYAVAQGPVSIGGFSVAGAAAGVQKNHPTVGRIIRGAVVEREVPIQWSGKHKMTLKLNRADFTTALRIAELINKMLANAAARPLDSGTVNFMVPEGFRDNLAVMVADLENLEVTPDSVAKVIINERTGTIVIGENVRISTVAVAHGALSIQIRERPVVTQPPPFAPRGAETVVTPETEIQVLEEARKLLVLESGPTINELVQALNAIGVTPRDLIVIFQTIKAAGALHAELEII